MPESKEKAKVRAKRLGFKQSQVVKGDKGYFIAPHGVKSEKGKKTYVKLRSKGYSKEQSAKIAYTVEKRK